MRIVKNNIKKFVLTEKNAIHKPIIEAKFDIKQELDYLTTTSVTFNNGKDGHINIYISDKIPRGFSDKVQAIPLHLFLNECDKNAVKYDTKPFL